MRTLSRREEAFPGEVRLACSLHTLPSAFPLSSELYLLAWTQAALEEHTEKQRIQWEKLARDHTSGRVFRLASERLQSSRGGAFRERAFVPAKY